MSDYYEGDIVRATYRSGATGEYAVTGKVWKAQGSRQVLQVGEQWLGQALSVEVLERKTPECPFAIGDVVWGVRDHSGPFVVTGWTRWNNVWQVQYRALPVDDSQGAGGGTILPEELTKERPSATQRIRALYATPVDGEYYVRRSDVLRIVGS